MQSNDTIKVVQFPLWSAQGDLVAFTKIDATDVPLIDEYEWRLGGNGYVLRMTQLNGKNANIYLHKVILGIPYGTGIGNGIQADHIDRDRLNNCRVNLRVVTSAQNKQNQGSRKGSTSRFRGVSWHTVRNTWRASVTMDGKYYYLGNFHDEEEAAKVASDFRRILMPYSVED